MQFSGVFDTGSIFQDGGWDMDEAGRNGGKWHLAQQIVQPVIRYVLSSVTFQQQITYHVTIQKQQLAQPVIKSHSLIHNNN